MNISLAENNKIIYLLCNIYHNLLFKTSLTIIYWLVLAIKLPFVSYQ